ncbi:hypothetical protein BD410DRAFT_289340 [Rickenella mellea]|uniref:Uncharacterized protein n=1 Tax=Rickenella mellea TaxID=50990 RepID=A0A4Y7Q3L9_9AGAM|nr:hypothetical protein BD410DRAFT_289340 [Rickenella mellea]
MDVDNGVGSSSMANSDDARAGAAGATGGDAAVRPIGEGGNSADVEQRPPIVPSQAPHLAPHPVSYHLGGGAEEYHAYVGPSIGSGVADANANGMVGAGAGVGMHRSTIPPARTYPLPIPNPRKRPRGRTVPAPAPAPSTSQPQQPPAPPSQLHHAQHPHQQLQHQLIHQPQHQSQHPQHPQHPHHPLQELEPHQPPSDVTSAPALAARLLGVAQSAQAQAQSASESVVHYALVRGEREAAGARVAAAVAARAGAGDVGSGSGSGSGGGGEGEDSMDGGGAVQEERRRRPSRTRSFPLPTSARHKHLSSTSLSSLTGYTASHSHMNGTGGSTIMPLRQAIHSSGHLAAHAHLDENAPYIPRVSTGARNGLGLGIGLGVGAAVGPVRMGRMGDPNGDSPSSGSGSGSSSGMGDATYSPSSTVATSPLSPLSPPGGGGSFSYPPLAMPPTNPLLAQQAQHLQQQSNLHLTLQSQLSLGHQPQPAPISLPRYYSAPSMSFPALALSAGLPAGDGGHTYLPDDPLHVPVPPPRARLEFVRPDAMNLAADEDAREGVPVPGGLGGGLLGDYDVGAGGDGGVGSSGVPGDGVEGMDDGDDDNGGDGGGDGGGEGNGTLNCNEWTGMNIIVETGTTDDAEDFELGQILPESAKERDAVKAEVEVVAIG